MIATRRIRSLYVRYKKSSNPSEWLERWNKACAKSWDTLKCGTPSLTKLERWKRNHRKLINLAKNKNKSL